MSLFFSNFVKPLITLDALQVHRADDVARRRHDLARQYNRQHGNKGNVTTLEQLRGARAELAASLYFHSMRWNDVIEGAYLHDEPDLEQGDLGIDIKSIGNPNYRLIAYKVHPERAYLLVDASEHPDYWLTGWLFGHQLLGMHRQELQAGRPCYVADQSQLLDPAHLRSMAYAHVA